MATERLWQDSDSSEDLLLPQVATQFKERKYKLRKLFPISIVRRTSRSTVLLCGTLILFVWGLFISINYPPSIPQVSSDTLLDTHQETFQPPPPPPELEVPDPPEIDVVDPIDEAAEQAAKLWKERAESVRDAFKTAYNAYETFASPHDELLPLTNRSKDNFNGWGVTTVDSLDTMFLMGLHDEFQRGIKLVDNMTFFGSNYTYAPFFETTIRYLGGLLSAYALSGEYILLKRADELGSAMLPVFNTSSGLPLFSVNPLSGETGTGWSGSVNGLLAEIATCQLEYKYLAHVTGKREYYDVAENINDKLYAANITNLDGLLPTSFNLKTGQPANQRVSLGATADSAYEYFLKQWLMTNQTESKTLEMYLRTADKIIENLLYLSPIRNLLYVTDVQFWREKLRAVPKVIELVDISELDDDVEATPNEPEPIPEPEYVLTRTPSRKFEHLSCFLPGLFALGVQKIPEDILPQETRERHLRAAEGLGYACWMMYADEPSGLGPDEVTFYGAYDMRSLEVQREQEAERARQKALAEAKAKEDAEALEKADVALEDSLDKRVPKPPPVIINQTAFDEAHLWLPAYDLWISSGREGPAPGLVHVERANSSSKMRDYRVSNRGYFLRPETVESFFLLWKTTGDVVWRERGWHVFEALLESAQTPEGAFASVENVQWFPSKRKNEMPSFFLAETLKYLYLLFNDEELIPLDQYVFNTEAHPLPIFQWNAWEKKKFDLAS